MNEGEVDRLAEGFVIEYLERDPEYLDVVEYVSENAEEPDEIDDTLLVHIFESVVGFLDVAAQRFEDANN